MDIDEQLKDGDRGNFGRKILNEIGHEVSNKSIKKSLISMQHTKHIIKPNCVHGGVQMKSSIDKLENFGIYNTNPPKFIRI